MHKGDAPEEMTKREGRFLREVTMLSSVQHKNLVKVYFCSHVDSFLLKEMTKRKRRFLMHLFIENYACLFHSLSGPA